ncbi:uncharacterized protein TNCV_3156541 [Trichonephila clavipes]|nr:uncharacterized protein TNCV_3156541 [Trichonephila clavipes]
MNRCPYLVIGLKKYLYYLRPQASLVLIFRPNVAGMKGRVDLAQPVNISQTCGVEARYNTTRPYSVIFPASRQFKEEAVWFAWKGNRMFQAIYDWTLPCSNFVPGMFRKKGTASDYRISQIISAERRGRADRRPIRRLSKVMYGSTFADMQVDVMGECLSSTKHVVGARRNRRQTAGDIARHTTQATGRPILRFTVARRLHGGSLFARRPVRCVPLTPAHRRRRSLWFREQRNWRDNECGPVLFTDESRFSLSSDSHRILIWRERGSHNHPLNIIERDRGAMGLQFLFMDDNAPCHRPVAAEQLLESEDIKRMDWPARSPDLNPIEHVWDFLGRRLAARTLPPVTIREL